jgi:DNA recombination protein RmuC
MNLVIGLVIGALFAAVVALVLRQRSGTASPGVVPPVADEVNRAVAEALDVAMQRLGAQARADREEIIQLATERITRVGGDELGKRAEVIDATVKGVQQAITERMAAIDAEVKRLRELNVEKFGNVDKAVSELARRTSDLNRVLSNAGARGQWGERMAEDLLRSAGFIEGVNYEKQDTINGGGRPDYTFKLPPDRVLYMDVKFPLDSYAKFVEATDDTSRATLRSEFLKAVRDRVRELQRREYVATTDAAALDYVLLFVPNESINGFIHESDPTLIDWALQQKVLLCSPLTLYAFLGVVRQATDSFHTEETAAKVMQLVTQFKGQWQKYVEELAKVQRRFDAMHGELESLTTGTRYRALNRQMKRIDDVRVAQGVPELPAGDDIADGSDDDALLELEPDEG